MQKNICLLYVTFQDKKEFDSITDALLNNKLIACANMLGKVESKFLWQNKVQTSSEIAGVYKLPKANYIKVENYIKNYHSYDIPCIIELEVKNGNLEFIEWVASSCLKYIDKKEFNKY